MSRNAIVAFALILLTSWFFFSPWYYKYILKQPYPYSSQTAEKKEKKDSADGAEQKSKGAEALNGEKTEVVEKPAQLTEIMAAVAGNSMLTSGSATMESNLDTVMIETDKLICKISELGARIISIKTKEYGYNRTHRGAILAVDSMIELIPDTGRIGGANLSVDNHSYDSVVFAYQDSHTTIRTNGERKELRFVSHGNNGFVLTKRFVFEPASYRIGLSVESPALQGKNIMLGWKCGIRESEEATGSSSDQYNRLKAHLYSSEVEHFDMKKPGQEDNGGQFKWIGITSKYFLVALVPQSVRDADVTIRGFVDERLKASGTKGGTTNYGITIKRMSDDAIDNYWIYAGPAQIEELRNQKVKLEKVLYGGWSWFLRADIWFPIICEYFLLLMIVIQKGVRDWGVAILLITVIIKLITYPLSLSSMKSMSKMKDLQPKLTALKAKYKANPRKMNEEMMAMYKAEGVNPLNPGCLPMFLQMPLLIALFIVLQRAIELRGAPTFLVPWVNDLSMPEAIFYLPFTVPWYGNNFALIPIVMAVLTFFQNRMTIKDPNQKFMIWFMPIFMFVLFNNFPSGLVIYWTLSSALGLVQQVLVDKAIKKGKTTATTLLVEAEEKEMAVAAGVSSGDFREKIYQRAGSMKISREAAEKIIKSLSRKSLQKLADATDTNFSAFLMSAPGTEARAKAARNIGIQV